MSLPTDFGDMFDEFELQVKNIFVNHKELTDNVVIENNSELQLKKGYCVEWRDADNTERMLNGKSVRQAVLVTNTLANNGAFDDIPMRKKAVKDILINCNNLIQYIEDNPTLEGKAVLVKFINHNGAEFIIDRENKAYLMIQATYQLEWF